MTAEYGQAVKSATPNKAVTATSRNRLIGSVVNSLKTIQEFTQLTKRSGRALWLVPMMGVLMLVAVLLVFIQIVEYVAPFVYTIF